MHNEYINIWLHTLAMKTQA